MSVSYSKTSRASLYPCTRGVAAIPLFASLHDVCRLAPLILNIVTLNERVALKLFMPAKDSDERFLVIHKEISDVAGHISEDIEEALVGFVQFGKFPFG